MGTFVVVSLFATGGWAERALWTFAYLPYAFFLGSSRWPAVGCSACRFGSGTDGVAFPWQLHAALQPGLGWPISLASWACSSYACSSSSTPFCATISWPKPRPSTGFCQHRTAGGRRAEAPVSLQLQELETLREVSRLKTQFMNSAAHNSIRHSRRSNRASPAQEQDRGRFTGAPPKAVRSWTEHSPAWPSCPDLLDGARCIEPASARRTPPRLGRCGGRSCGCPAPRCREAGVRLQVHPGAASVGPWRWKRLAQVMDNLVATQSSSRHKGPHRCRAGAGAGWRRRASEGLGLACKKGHFQAISSRLSNCMRRSSGPTPVRIGLSSPAHH